MRISWNVGISSGKGNTGEHGCIASMPMRKGNCLPVTSTKEPRFLVHIAYRAQISTKDFEVGVLSDIVFRHLKHAQMKEGNWTERTACDENYGRLVWIANDSGKAMVREGVVWGVCEFLGKVDG